MGRVFHIAKFLHLLESAVETHTHTHTHTSRLSCTLEVGDTLFYRYYPTLLIPVRWKICFTRNLDFEMEGIWSEHGKTVWINQSISLRLLLLLPAYSTTKGKLILYFIFSQCRTRKEPFAKHHTFNDEKAIGFVLTPTSKMELDACLLEHLGRICCGREWHIPSCW